MALNEQQIATSYPLPVYNYRVHIDSQAMAFSEVSGLNAEYERVIYKDGFSYLNGPNIIRAQQKELSITLKRGIVQAKDELNKWMNSGSRKDITIDLCDPQGVALVSWKVRNALPLKLNAPSFNAAGNEVAIEQLELIAMDLTIEYR